MQMSSPVRQLTLNSFQLRDSDPVVEIREQVDKNKLPFILGLIDVNDTFNVGTAFRLADAMGVKELILFGKTECPPNPRIDKASVGTHKWVNWKYVNNVNTYIDQFRIENPEYKIIAVEQSSASISIYNSNLHFPVLLLLGNETAGIDDAILQRCDEIWEIPMYGINKSMNVIVSGAMAISLLMHRHSKLHELAITDSI